MMSDRTPHDGQPYYCNACGLGLGEYMACEDGGCKLESLAEAKDRQRKWLESLQEEMMDCYQFGTVS